MKNLNIAPTLRRIWLEIQDMFFPKNCLNCHAEGAWLCESCADSLFFMDKDSGFCPFCGCLVDSFGVCEICRGRAGVKKVFSLFKYKDPLAQKLVKNLKYRYLKGIAEELAPLFRKFLFKYKNLLEIHPVKSSDKSEVPEGQFNRVESGTVLVPVPLHWYRECDRGFNQAGELAKVIGKILGLPVENKLAFKRKSKSQAELEKEERFSNLKNCFVVKNSPPKNIIIVDDVFTTGSTVRELAMVLQSKGAEKIQVITLARG